LDSSGFERGQMAASRRGPGRHGKVCRQPLLPRGADVKLVTSGTDRGTQRDLRHVAVGLRSALAVTGSADQGSGWMAEMVALHGPRSDELQEDHRTVTFEAGGQLDPRQPSIPSALAIQVHKCRISGCKRTPRRL
jgi:hypothetical protein